MRYYLKVIMKYAVFEGRASRKEFWLFGLIDLIIFLFAMMADNILGTTIKSNHDGIVTTHYGYIYCSYMLALLIPRIAVFVRRMHDIDKSGWLALILFIPIVGGVIGFIMALLPGTMGYNDYGPDPKMEEFSS